MHVIQDGEPLKVQVCEAHYENRPLPDAAYLALEGLQLQSEVVTSSIKSDNLSINHKELDRAHSLIEENSVWVSKILKVMKDETVPELSVKWLEDTFSCKK